MKKSLEKIYGFNKAFASLCLSVFSILFVVPFLLPVTFAASPGTVIPEIGEVNKASGPSGVYCNNLLGKSREDLQKILDDPGSADNEKETSDILGCAIKTGRIGLWMVPYFIRYFIEFILYVGGLVAVGGILYGGATYMFSGLSNDKEKGKKAILYSVVGMILMYTAWAIVNIAIGLLTG